jgi:hypothetical protein
VTLPQRSQRRVDSRLVPNDAQPRIPSTAPWSEVVYIETRTGRCGGEEWKLTLACTHVAFRRVPKISPQTMIRRLFRGPITAPKKVRCIVCAYTRR